MIGPRLDVLLLCVLCALCAFGCDDDPNPQTKPKPQRIISDLPGALLGVWGSSAADVWVVGSDPNDGLGPYVLHFDGQTWTRLPSGQQGGLWWVWSQGPQQPLWMCGEAGLLMRLDRETLQFTRIQTPQPARLFGVFPLGDQDVWIVGEDTLTHQGILWRFDGQTVSQPLDLPPDAATSNAWFKVWGRSPDDLWVVGLGDKALHRTASGWQIKNTPRRLFTLHGDSTSRVVAVGGFASGLVVEGLGDSPLSDITPPDAPQLNGVWVSDDGTLTTAGIYGTLLQKTPDGAWLTIQDVPVSDKDFHAVYRDPNGGLWAVGGLVVSEPLRDGLLVYHGESPPPPYP